MAQLPLQEIPTIELFASDGMHNSALVQVDTVFAALAFRNLRYDLETHDDASGTVYLTSIR